MAKSLQGNASLMPKSDGVNYSQVRAGRYPQQVPRTGDLNPDKERRRGPDIGLWSKIPSKFFGSGTAAILGCSASLTYLALCEHANRNASNKFRASDKALASDTNLSPRTLSDARKRLVEENLISIERGNGQSFVYTLLPLSLQWVRLEDRPRAKQKPRALHASRATEKVQK